MNEVIHLAFRNPDVETSSQEVLSCGTCKNKTWVAVYEASGNGFPRLKCAACSQDAGHFGWVDAKEKP
jgi:hypothetical protein